MAASSKLCAMGVKLLEHKSRCARFFITCPRVANFFVLKTPRAATSSTRFICKPSAILRSASPCCETTACYFSYQPRQQGEADLRMADGLDRKSTRLNYSH